MEFLRRRLSDGNFLAGGMGGEPPAVGGGAGRPPRTPPAAAPLLLVIAPPGTDWVKPFKGKSVHGDAELRVEQAQFSELSLAASTHGALSVAIDAPRGGSRRVRPDFVLVREAPEGGAGGAPRRLLAGLHLGGVPSADPLPALYGFAHPPCLFAQLARLQRELGHEAFPLVPQRFCNRPRGLLTSPTFPMSVTLSPAPAGVGQVRVGSPQVLGAVAAAMGGARAGALLRAEPPGAQRLRVQRIGDQYRALRWSPGGGDSAGEGPQVEPVALSPRHRGWVDACAGLFGGVDICGVEALRGPDGQEHIVQVLGSWLPLLGPGAAEDRGHIVELVLERMREELPRPRSPSPARPLPQASATSGSPRPGTPPQQRPQPQGAPPPSGPAQPRPPPQGQPRPQMGGASPRGPAQARPLAGQPRPQSPSATPQPRPTSPQPRPQTPPSAAQPRPQTPPSSPQPQAPPPSQPRPPLASASPQPRPPTPQPRPQAPPTSPQPRPPSSPTAQPRPQAPPTSQPRPQAPPTSQPRPPGPAGSPQVRPQAPPTSQPRPQAPPTSAPQPRPPGPATSPQPRPQAPPTSPQPRLQRSPSVPQPRPQAPPPAASPRPPGPQAPPTTRQPRPQAPPIAPKPALAPKPGSAPPPSPAPEQGPPESLRALRQSFASLFTD